jgi:hypothetical protein
MTIGLHMMLVMTTGLQRAEIRHHRLATREPVTRLAGALRLIGVRLRAASPRASTARPAHDIRRGVRATRSTTARDLHDAAVLGGVFPPRY